MKQRFNLYLFFFLVCLFTACEQEMLKKGSEEFEKIRYEQYTLPPRTGSCIDSVKAALQNAAEVSGYGNKDMINSSFFEFYYNMQDDAVIKIRLRDYPIIVHVSQKLIRQYDWNGYLLIALHEWYHIYVKPIHNHDAHAVMVNDSEYHLWIQRTLGCSLEVARWLAYVGTENTPIYDNLPGEEKQIIENCIKEFHIKVKNR